MLGIWVDCHFSATKNAESPESTERYAGNGLPAHLRDISSRIGFQLPEYSCIRLSKR